MANKVTEKFGLTVVLCIFAVISINLADEDHGPSAISLTGDTFDASLEKNRNFVMFFAPWCGHCKNLAPTWNELAKFYNKMENGPVIIAKVDCTVEKALCAAHDVTGFPTLKLFELSQASQKRYSGKRDLDSLKTFVQDHLQTEGEQGEEEEAQKPEIPDQKDAMMILDDENFEVEISAGLFFIKFYAPWCGHCKKLAPIWEDLADSFANSDEVSIAKIDCTQNPVSCGENQVRGYPTLLLFRNGEKAGQYQGVRTHEALKKYVQEQIESEEKVKMEEEEEAVTQGHAMNELPDSLDGGQGTVTELTEDTFSSHLKEQLVFVKFFAPWCGHCKRLAPTWDDLAKDFVTDPVSIAKVDCTQNKLLCEENKVRGYPTLKLFRNGDHVTDYKGSRSLEDLSVFIKGYLEDIHDEL